MNARWRLSIAQLALATLLFTALLPRARANDAPASNDALFAAAVESLEKGAPTRAIDNLELLADRGVTNPDASFNRGLAYAARAESPQRRPGDLGRAVAAFAEAIRLAPADDEAKLLLESVREEIARRRARRGAEPIATRASLGWAVVELLPERAWAIGAAAGSALLSIGLALAMWVRRRPVRITGAVLIGVGALLLVSFGSLAWAAKHRRSTYNPAIVVAPEARLTDLAGRKAASDSPGLDAVVEGAEVNLLERRGHRARIAWHGAQGWVDAEVIRPLPQR